MASVSTYLNFEGRTLEAFTFYKDAFGTEFMGVMRHGDVPLEEGQEGPSEADKDLIINIALPITGGHILMGTDVSQGLGTRVTHGNGTHVCLHPDTREEADRLFAALAEGGEVEMPMSDMFWGDYYGSFRDKFGIQWMIDVMTQPR